jgi:hypothetical protein
MTKRKPTILAYTSPIHFVWFFCIARMKVFKLFDDLRSKVYKLSTILKRDCHYLETKYVAYEISVNYWSDTPISIVTLFWI